MFKNYFSYLLNPNNQYILEPYIIMFILSGYSIINEYFNSSNNINTLEYEYNENILWTYIMNNNRTFNLS
jgi:hypothetical protein